MDERNITRNDLARACNTRFEVINKWYQGSETQPCNNPK